MKEDNTMQDPARELEALRREVAYLRGLSEQTIAKMLRLDAESVAIRHELEQKRRGFKLMAELTGSQARHGDPESLFVSISRRLNAALGMQRTVVLKPVPGGVFRPAVMQGYSAPEEEALASRLLVLPPEFLAPDDPVLVTGADPVERFASLRETLGLPFLIAAPVFLRDELAAVLVTGRLLEQHPYLPPLGGSDVETVRTVCAHLATILAGRLVVEADQRTKIMLDAMPFCCNFWDEHHNNIDCNEAAARLFDLANKSEYLEKFYELSPEYQPNGRLSAELAAEKIHEAFTTGTCRFEWLHQKLNGDPVPSEITLVRVGWGDGFIVAGYTRDLREQKTMLAAMQKTQDELLLARDLAEKNAKAKSEFLANMSHEIRTPMNAILGMTYLLGRTDVTEKQRGYLDQTEHSANLLLRIINDILDFSKLDAGRMKIDAIAFSLRQTMRHVHDIVRGESSAKSIRLYTNVDDRAADALVGDPLRLEQVLLNLTNNAVKFTPPGGELHVRVRQQALADDKAELRFEVQDSGIGMTPDEVDRLFQPFSQGDTSATRRYGGTGLGLAVSRRIVKLMGGEISCASTVGKGSIFSFVITLPLPVKDASLPQGSPFEGERDSLAGLRVLLAEDNEINQMIAEELLAAKNILVRTVNTGQEALDVLMEEPFDLVLMDIQMPEMDGLTATMCIRANPAHADLPIIAMTAHAMNGDRETSLESGMNDHITKPIDPGILYAVLRRWDSRGKK